MIYLGKLEGFLMSASGHFLPVESLSPDRRLPGQYRPVSSDEIRRCLPNQVAIITVEGCEHDLSPTITQNLGFDSRLLFPMATHAYCSGSVRNMHLQPRHRTLIDRYGVRSSQLQHRFQGKTGRMQGGMTLSDFLGHRHGGLLFR